MHYEVRKDRLSHSFGLYYMQGESTWQYSNAFIGREGLIYGIKYFATSVNSNINFFIGPVLSLGNFNTRSILHEDGSFLSISDPVAEVYHNRILFEADLTSGIQLKLFKNIFLKAALGAGYSILVRYSGKTVDLNSSNEFKQAGVWSYSRGDYRLRLGLGYRFSR